VKAATLTVCSDTSYPPQESLDASNKAIGSDIDLATELAKRLSLTLEVQVDHVRLDHPGPPGRKLRHHHLGADDHAERQAAVDMIPYFAAGQSSWFWRATRAPSRPSIPVRQDRRRGEGHHRGRSHHRRRIGLRHYEQPERQLQDQGKSDITLQVFDADTNALAALQAGQW